MVETIRRYWIGFLVLLLVGLHGGIVGFIRYQASLAKIDASCEVDLGTYLAFQPNATAPLQMRLHAIVPLAHRMKSRQLIELNRAQVRQAIEEHLRQIDRALLVDPFLSDLKSHLLEVMVQTIGDSSIDDLVITEVREAGDSANVAFVSRSNPQAPRLVATLRNKTDGHAESPQAEHPKGASSGDDEDEHGEDHEDEPASSKKYAEPPEGKKSKEPSAPEKKKSSSKESKKSSH